MTEQANVAPERVAIPKRGATYWTLNMASIPYKRTCRYDEVDIFNLSYGFYWKSKDEAQANAEWHEGFIQRIHNEFTALSGGEEKENLT